MRKAIALSLLLAVGTISAHADVTATSSTASIGSAAPVTSTAKPMKAKKKKTVKTVAAAKKRTLSLSVTDQGFVPADLKVVKGEPVNLVITRQTDQTCVRQIIIPGYGVSQDLPLNVPVTVALTPKDTGEINYSCGMGMIRGVLTVE
jgi:plastocyanin domain-containing protein